MEKVIVYTSNSCTYCTAVKNYLKQNDVEFEERNVSKPEYRKELINLGFMSVPVLKIGDEVIKGFDINAINNSLGL
ncbi:MAG: glutaredoxin family protein [Clostridiales bacterium]|uniref:glutaredoxin family protein n=1 Tax=Clostridium sp. N3C TaxID=1776758 RepID=UPI00092E1D14|nr:glutaredoxin family protein [Clostridium sp. N3C]NLZ48282.1 glutaredoxin family protein [Clostridiales bacterium]SCN22929.1 Glutaredoxin-like protein NrdH [Clostridium sp. N3C]